MDFRVSVIRGMGFAGYEEWLIPFGTWVWEIYDIKMFMYKQNSRIHASYNKERSRPNI